MACALNLCVHEPIGKRQRPIPVVDSPDDLFDRPTIGIHGIPYAKKLDLFDRHERDVFEARFTYQVNAEEVTNGAQRMQVVARHRLGGSPLAVLAICDDRLRPQLVFVVVVRGEPNGGDEPGNNADGERTAAEAEAEDSIARLVVAGAKAIDVQYVSLQTDAEDAGEGCPPFERRRSDAVIIKCDLLVGVDQIERLI